VSHTPQPWSERGWFSLPFIRTAAALSPVNLTAVATVRYSTFKIALPPAEPLLWHYSRPLLSELYFLDLCLSTRSWIRVEPQRHELARLMMAGNDWPQGELLRQLFRSVQKRLQLALFVTLQSSAVHCIYARHGITAARAQSANLEAESSKRCSKRI